MMRRSWLLIVLISSSVAAGLDEEPCKAAAAGPHVFGASDSIERIDVEVVYYVPLDGEPLRDWRERIEYHLRRVKKFHRRELCGQSELVYNIYASPFIASVTRSGFPQDDVNRFFWHIMDEVRNSGRISFAENMFPILLVMSDANFSPSYDDWSRTCARKGCVFEGPHSKCEGHVTESGEDRPGTRCGGARSVFWPEKHMGLGLVTADGWRVPIKGTDCVVYHEGIGHAIGLPHPEPLDNSVMGVAQYVDSINNTWIRDDQKQGLGWRECKIDRTDLFSRFQVGHSPRNPSATDTVTLFARFPSKFVMKSLEAEYQNDLRQPFRSLGEPRLVDIGGEMLAFWTVSPTPKGCSIGYRIRIETVTGEREMIWDYYKVRY